MNNIKKLDYHNNMVMATENDISLDLLLDDNNIIVDDVELLKILNNENLSSSIPPLLLPSFPSDLSSAITPTVAFLDWEDLPTLSTTSTTQPNNKKRKYDDDSLCSSNSSSDEEEEDDLDTFLNQLEFVDVNFNPSSINNHDTIKEDLPLDHAFKKQKFINDDDDILSMLQNQSFLTSNDLDWIVDLSSST